MAYPLNYQHLKYFWTVFRHGSLTRASKELYLTPQTVSSQLRDLETAMGEKLYEKQGRGLILTEVGKVVFSYADEIFTIGKELQDAVKGLPSDRPIKLVVGVADVVPKFIAHHLIEPALKMDKRVHVVCHEGSLEELLGDLAQHKCDVVLADCPIPSTVKIKAYNHDLGECGATFLAVPALAKKLKKNFPQSLNGERILLPIKSTMLRQKMDDWFAKHDIVPDVVGEFENSALLKAFGQTGAGVFTVPSVIHKEMERQYSVKAIGTAEDITEHFYAISVERRIQNPAVTAICSAGRSMLFHD